MATDVSKSLIARFQPYQMSLIDSQRTKDIALDIAIDFRIF